MDSKRLGDDIDDEHDDGWPLKDIVSIVSVCGSTDQHRSHETANLETCSRARLSQVLDSYYWYLVYLTGGLVTSDWSAILATILFFYQPPRTWSWLQMATFQSSCHQWHEISFISWKWTFQTDAQHQVRRMPCHCDRISTPFAITFWREPFW